MGRNLLRYGLITCYGPIRGGRKMMTFDENLFFREATLRLCSSLEIEAALKRCYEYIRPFIPVKRMGLHLVDLEENTV